MVKRSIFKKLLITMVGLIISLLTMLTFVQIEFQRDVFEKELEKRIVLMKGRLIDKGQILSDSLSVHVKNGVAAANLSWVGDQLRNTVHENKELHYIILMHASRAYINTLNPQSEMAILSESQDLFAEAQKTAAVNEYISNGKSFMEFIMPIQVSSKPWGVLRLGFSLDLLLQEIVNSREDSTRQIRQMIEQLLITTAIFILIGACIVLFLSERLSRPLMHLTRLANELAEGDFTVSDQVKEIRQDGEIGALTTAFVQMAKNLKISYDKLEEYSRTLEQKVINRTSELAEARDQAVAADKSKSEFLSMMSHEIRTPMNAIIGMTRLALQTDLTVKQQDYLTKVQVSSRALLGIINDILDFSKIEAGKMEMETIAFNLNEVLNDLSSLMTDKAEEKGLHIQFITADEVPLYLMGDPLRLGQILLNLVSNAIKFTHHGDIVIKIALAESSEPITRADQIMLEFSVKDTGIGLTAEQIGGLFQSFNQADKSTTRQYGGTGLGLAICKRMVEMMSGVINVTSEIGKGSTFRFTAVFGQIQGVNQKRVTLRDAFRGVKALVVDANEASRDALCLYLETFFFQVTQAGSGEQAIQVLENAPLENSYQLILMDWNLPEMDGISVTRHIKDNLKMTPAPHIIMITTHNTEDITQRLNDLNLDGFLIKPVHPSALFDVIVDAFGQNYFDEYLVLQARSADTIDKRHPKTKGTKLLLVEDNRINQQVAKETLEQEGFDVSIATDGQDAVQKIRANYFDVVLMDLQMPIMDGYEATRIIRSESKFDDLPIIAMTAHAMSDVRKSCLDVGMNGYVTKPIDVDKLLASLINVIKPELRKTPNSCLSKIPQQSALLPESLPGIDMQQVLKNVLGNIPLLRDVLLKFHEGYSDTEARLNAFLLAGDADSALKLLHALKGVAATLSMLELKTCIEALEQTLKKQWEYEPGLLTDFAIAQNRVLESIGQLHSFNDE
ncbi:MAG: response regulator [Methylobacter sp.]|nr:MAG: response regulator [Methylobacter sp.]